ncbi:MAG: DUF2079 domain-containing protein [Deltaproteobacteria bacterium]|nr:DUF2079 domain-containing protein [Deltaproteobacteria bacterium]
MTEDDKEKKMKDTDAPKSARVILNQSLKTLDEWILKIWEVTRQLLTWLPWTILIGTLPGLIVWQITSQPEQLEKLVKNQIPGAMSVAMYAAVSTASVLLLSVIVHRFVAHRWNIPFSGFCRKINRFGLMLVLVPFYLFVRSPEVSKESPLFTLLLCAGAGGVAAFAAYGIRKFGAVFNPQDGGQIKKSLPLFAVTLLALAWTVFVAKMGLNHHRHLGTAGWDFGLYINSIWQSLHGNPLACSLLQEGTHASRHFDPILVLLSPILLIRPGAEAQTLIILQVAWIASAVVPLYQLAAHHGKNAWIGVVFAVTYLLHPVFHGPAIYEFHSLTIAGPFMLWCIHFLDTGAHKRFFVFLFLLLLCREDMAAIALTIGVYALISGKSRLVAVGAMAMSLIYGGLVYFAIFSKAVSYSQYFDEIQQAERSVMSNIVLTAVTNPVYMLRYMLTEAKIIYILQLIVPILFLPVVSSRYRVLFLFGLFVTLFGSASRLFSISMQYSTWWLPLMFAALPAAFEWFSTGRMAGCLKMDSVRLRGALVAGMLVSAFTMSAAYGIFWPNPEFRTGYKKLIREPNEALRETALTVARLEQMIPRGASVIASEHLISHFAARQWIWTTENVNYRFSKPDYGIVWNRDLRNQENRKVKMKRRQKYLDLLRSKEYKRILHENGISVYKRQYAD